MKCPSTRQWINCTTSIQWIIIQELKEMSYQTSKRHEENVNVHYCVNEANLKKLRNVSYQLHNILRKLNNGDRKGSVITTDLGGTGEAEGGIGEDRGFLGQGNYFM